MSTPFDKGENVICQIYKIMASKHYKLMLEYQYMAGRRKKDTECMDYQHMVRQH